MQNRSGVNVLIFDGPGVSQSCLKHLRDSLTSLLSPRYDVLTISAEALRRDPWTDNCALLCFPGGRDVAYLSSLGADGCERIAAWVAGGGRYLGICAGAYFASDSISFERGRQGYQVEGDRPLKFFPGKCTGTAFKGFEYDTENGARDCMIDLEAQAFESVWHGEAPLSQLAVYYNGGGAFEDINSDRVTFLARYAELHGRPPAGVLCKVGGHGKALLWAVHPEHPSTAPHNAASATVSTFDNNRKSLLKASLRLLDLDVPEERRVIFGPTPLVLVGESPDEAAGCASEIHSRFSQVSRVGSYVDAHDTFTFHGQQELQSTFAANRSIEHTRLDVVVCSNSLPDPAYTPIFQLESFYTALTATRRRHAFSFRPSFGSLMFYGEVVTSTQTVLEKNPRLLAALPTGFVFVGSHQIAGRGRGTNNWLSPPGCLQFSMVLRADRRLGPKLVFVQYLFGLSVVQAVRTMPGYESLGLRLKWPNDLYADLGKDAGGVKKIGGILVNSMYAGNDFTIIIGCGINTTNFGPTTSVLDLIETHNARHGSSLPVITQEQLLASILPMFERNWATFDREGNFSSFADLYTQRWLHSGAEVTIQATGQQVRIVGLNPENGNLRTQPCDSKPDDPKSIDLQPDGNSFDMMQGLLKTKTSR